jgi:hypothetical protein
VITDHVYYLAERDIVYGGDAPRLKNTWLAHRVSEKITRYDGASRWTAENGMRVVRVVRASAAPGKLVDVLDVAEIA